LSGRDVIEQRRKNKIVSEEQDNDGSYPKSVIAAKGCGCKGLSTEGVSDGTPGPLSFRDCSAEQRKEENRGATGDIYQKTVATESSHGDEGGGNRRVHGCLDRPARQAVASARYAGSDARRSTV